MKLFEDGVKVTKIAAQEKVTRQTVCDVVLGDQFMKLLRSKMKLERPLRTEDQLFRLMMVVDRLISKVQTVWHKMPELTGPQLCVYCGKKLVYSEERSDESGRIETKFKCTGCKKEYPLVKIERNDRSPEVV